MGSYAYILAAAFIITGSIILFNTRADANRADLDLGRVQMKQEARDAAVTGLNLTIRKLAEIQTAWDNPDDYEMDLTEFGGRGATFETVVTIVDTVAGDTVDVVATGTKVYTTRTAEGRDTTHVIEARIARGFISGAIPPGFRSAIMSDNTMLVHGNFYVNALLPGVNADIHTNGTLDTRGNSFRIEGMGTYTGGERVSAQQEDNFVPDNDWNGGLSNVFQRDSIPLPDWDQDAFRTTAEDPSKGFYTNAAVEINGADLSAASIATVDDFARYLLGGDADPNITYGADAAHPFLVMVDNDLVFDGLIELDGYIQFGSTGDIDVQTHSPDDGLFMSYDLDIDAQLAATNAGIFTTGDIRVEGNATVIATLYSEGSITYLGGVHLIGGQVAHQTTFQGGGTVDIDWVGPGPGLEEYFDPYDEPIGPVIIAYAEW